MVDVEYFGGVNEWHPFAAVLDFIVVRDAVSNLVHDVFLDAPLDFRLRVVRHGVHCHEHGLPFGACPAANVSVAVNDFEGLGEAHGVLRQTCAVPEGVRLLVDGGKGTLVAFLEKLLA